MSDALPVALLEDLAGTADGLDARVARAVQAHPEAADALEPIGELLVDASIDLELNLQRNDALLACRGKLGPSGFVLAAPPGPGAPAGFWQVGLVTSAPRQIAQMVGVSPRAPHPHGGALLPIPTDALFLGCGRSDATSAMGPLIDAMTAEGYPRAAIEAILSPPSLLWQLEIRQAGSDEADRRITVTDTADDGLWLATELPSGMVLQAMSPSGIWRALCDTLDVLARD